MHDKTLATLESDQALPGLAVLCCTAAAPTFAPQPLVLSVSKDERRECPK